MTDHAFKIRIVNVQKAVEVHGSRIKSLDNTCLVDMIKRISLNLFRSSIKINQLRESAICTHRNSNDLSV